MKSLRTAWMFAVLVVCIGAVAVPAGATTIKSASGYGQFDPNFSNCFSSGSPCEAFQATGTTLVVNGNTESILQVTGGSNSFSGLSSLDLFDFGAVQAGTVISLPFQSWGLLTCGNGFGSGAVSTAFDSGGPANTISGLPCTPIDDVSGTGTALFGGSTLYLTADAAGNNVAFTILGNGSIQFDSSFTDAAFWFTPDSSTVPTPEPTSIALLGTGLATLIGLRRRKR